MTAVSFRPAAPTGPICVIGDVMLDCYVAGQTERISPEAPVPVVRVRNEHRSLGGAANVANNLLAFGCAVRLVSVIGSDESGTQLRDLLARRGMSVDGLVVDAGRATTQKTRIVSAGQQIVRFDVENTDPLAADITSALSSRLDAALAGSVAVIISDYGKGVVGAEIAQAAIARARRLGLPVLVDPKGSDYTKYRGATVITPNRSELGTALGRSIGTVSEAVAGARELMAGFTLQHAVVTLGAEGMVVVHGAESLHIPTQAREVFDVSGAGDTVIAALAYAVAGGAPVQSACQFANAAAGVVVGKVGTATATLDEIDAATGSAKRAAGKICDVDQLVQQVSRHRTQGRRIVFTNGCFDVLHAGHVTSLEAAAGFGDVLIVGLNSDASVRRLKGPDRPVNPQLDRATVLAALQVVDHVCVFDADTPRDLIAAVLPDVLVKGSDHAAASIVGADLVLARGGRVEVVPILPGRSTTNTITRMKQA